jgi:toxin FitB
MFVLDTNVISEIISERPDPAVLRWLGKRFDDEYRLTSITAAEMLYGVARMPEGRRKEEREAAIGMVIDVEYSDRILPFDVDAAIEYAGVLVARQRIGRPLTTADAMIAAIAASNGCALVTRNSRDFEGIGLDLVNPWEAT